MAKNFVKLMTNTKLQIQKTQRTQSRINTKQKHVFHIHIHILTSENQRQK